MIEDKLSTVYFSIPDSEGCFSVEEQKESYDEYENWYKIEHNQNDNIGKLFYIPGIMDLRAIENIDFYLNPVCEIQNIMNRKNVTKIEMLEPGEVYLSGNTWKINKTKPVKIKFA